MPAEKANGGDADGRDSTGGRWEGLVSEGNIDKDSGCEPIHGVLGREQGDEEQDDGKLSRLVPD